jgi:LysR family transcriptional regulator, benzoate and cis,cis-muconate-responsive activator of ben and cat genes
MELRLLRALVAVAEESSVSAAAARLRVAQPSLSRQLRLLERRLGLRLFERSGRRLRVTAAAEPVVEAARQALATADEVVRVAHRAADGRTGRLAIAVRTGSSPLLLMDVLAAFRRRHPDVETSITELTDDQLHHGLREGRLDVALVRIAAPDDLPHQVLMKEPLRLVVPSHHRLAGAERARIGDLAGERVVFYGRSVQPVAHDWLTLQLRAAGLSTVLQEATLPNILATVAAGLAVSVLVSAYESILRPPGIRFVPLDGLTVDLIMVWGTGPESPALRAFRHEIQRAMHTGTTRDST